MSKFLRLNLQFFGGEDGESATPAVTETAETTEVAPPVESFESLIGENGKYHKDFQNSLDKAFNKRFKDHKALEESNKALEEKVASYDSALESLYGLYGVTDAKALGEKINGSNAFWEEEAMNRGVSVDELKQQIRRESESKKLREENERLKAAEAERVRDAKTKEQYRVWDEQIAELKKTVPDFDLKTEMQNDTFAKVVNSGFSMADAYKFAHMNDIISASEKVGAQKAAQTIQARAARPLENAAINSPSVTATQKVAGLTAEERKAYAQRAMRGEVIDFVTHT